MNIILAAFVVAWFSPGAQGVQVPGEVVWSLVSLIVGSIVTQLLKSWYERKSDAANISKTLTETLEIATRTLRASSQDVDKLRRKLELYERILMEANLLPTEEDEPKS